VTTLIIGVYNVQTLVTEMLFSTSVDLLTLQCMGYLNL